MLVLGSDDFAKAIAEKLNAVFVLLEKRVFPDGEICPRITEPLLDKHVIFVNRLNSNKFNPNEYFVESLLVIRNLKEKGVQTIDFVMPYMVYSRQDKVFREGEPFSARKVLGLLADAGVNRIFTVSSHYERDKEILTAKIPVINIDGYEAVCGYIKKLGIENPIIAGADFSESVPIKNVSRHLGCESLVLNKKRDLNTGEIETKGELEKGRNVVIIDDEISSGGTIIKAIDICKKAESKSVSVFVIHGKFAGNALENVKAIADNLAVSDSINTPVSEFSIADLVAEKLK